MEPQRTELADEIGDYIRQHGPITFAQFMEWALYHPEHGYYMRGPSIGPRGDFTTSPEASPEFGRLLAKHVAEVDSLLDSPPTFDLVEYGPGKGTLAHDLLQELALRHPGLYTRLRYHLIEISPALVKVQKSVLLPEHAARVKWSRTLDKRDLRGVIIANEVVDAFPVHVLEVVEGVVCEQYVDLDGNDLALKPGPLSTPDLSEFLQDNDISAEEGDRIEIDLATIGWLTSAAGAFQRCIAVIIDYGDVAPGRYSLARREGTLLGYHSGKVTHEILANPGEQDLTALVDFTALQDDATKAGFDVVGMTRQATFLIGLGLGSTETEDKETNLDAALARRRGTQALVSMEGLGRFHVLLSSKGLDPIEAEKVLSGLKYADIL